MEDFMRYRAAYIFINRKLPNIDIWELREKLKSRVSGMRIAHTCLQEPEIICYLERDDERDMVRALNIEIGAFKDQDLIKSPDTKMIMQESGVGYTGREDSHPAPEAAWIEVYTEKGPIDPYVDALLQLRDGQDARVVNAHAVIGGPDIIGYVEANDRNSMIDLIENRIPAIGGIAKILTHLVYMRHTLELPRDGLVNLTRIGTGP